MATRMYDSVGAGQWRAEGRAVKYGFYEAMPAPAHCVTVQPQVRHCVVPARRRVAAAPRQDRTCVVPAQDRHCVVPHEDC